jgi:hypothetical protein
LPLWCGQPTPSLNWSTIWLRSTCTVRRCNGLLNASSFLWAQTDLFFQIVGSLQSCLAFVSALKTTLVSTAPFARRPKINTNAALLDAVDLAIMMSKRPMKWMKVIAAHMLHNLDLVSTECREGTAIF